MADQLLTSAQAAAMLHVSTKVLARLRDAGKIPFMQVLPNRKGVRYSERALAAWIAEHQQIERCGGGVR